MHPLVGGFTAAFRKEHPWGNDWRYNVPAYTLSTSFGLSAGIAIGCLAAGLPYWHAPLGVATAAGLARALVQVQFHLERRRHAAAAVRPEPRSA